MPHNKPNNILLTFRLNRNYISSLQAAAGAGAGTTTALLVILHLSNIYRGIYIVILVVYLVFISHSGLLSHSETRSAQTGKSQTPNEHYDLNQATSFLTRLICLPNQIIQDAARVVHTCTRVLCMTRTRNGKICSKT